MSGFKELVLGTCNVVADPLVIGDLHMAVLGGNHQGRDRDGGDYIPPVGIYMVQQQRGALGRGEFQTFFQRLLTVLGIVFRGEHHLHKAAGGADRIGKD